MRMSKEKGPTTRSVIDPKGSGHALLLESHVLSSRALYDGPARFCPQQHFFLFRSHPALALKREKSARLPLNGVPPRFHDKARRRGEFGGK